MIERNSTNQEWPWVESYKLESLKIEIEPLFHLGSPSLKWNQTKIGIKTELESFI